MASQDTCLLPTSRSNSKSERLRACKGGLERDQCGKGHVIEATDALGLDIDVSDI